MNVKQRLRRSVKDVEGENYRFYVPSDELGQPPYLIDLEEHGGRGHCECKDQRCVKDKNRKNGETDLYLTTCKHIRRAMLRYAQREVQKHVREERRRVEALKHA